MSDEDVVILCYRTTNPRVLIVDGASMTKCETCGHAVWIAPSSRRARQELKAKVVCEVCGIRPKPGEPIEIAPLNNEQLSEITDTLQNRKRRN